MKDHVELVLVACSARIKGLIHSWDRLMTVDYRLTVAQYEAPNARPRHDA